MAKNTLQDTVIFLYHVYYIIQNHVSENLTKDFALISGTVKSVSVEVGQIIGEGAECCVLEAMKMQNSLKIGATGTIKAVHVKPGDTVQADQVLVELE